MVASILVTAITKGFRLLLTIEHVAFANYIIINCIAQVYFSFLLSNIFLYV